MTILKNVVDTRLITLKPYNLIASIINLINPTLNSVVLLTLACKSNDSTLVKQLSFDEPGDDDDDIEEDENKHGIKNRLKCITFRLIRQVPCVKSCLNNKNGMKKKSGLNLNKIGEIESDDDFKKPSEKFAFKAEQNEIDLITECNNLCSATAIACNDESSFDESYNKMKKLKDIQSSSYSKNYYSSLNNIDEFYSKVGNRLGSSFN